MCKDLSFTLTEDTMTAGQKCPAVFVNFRLKVIVNND